MKRTKKLILKALTAAAVLVPAVMFWAQQECVEYTETFIETFATDVFRNEATTAANWPAGPVHLSHLGSNFQVANPAGMGARILACDGGDFDDDGYPDLIGYDIGNHRVLLLRNHYAVNGEAGPIFLVDETKVFDWDLTKEVYAVVSVAVGDFNNDGLLDFFLITNDWNAGFQYVNYRATMYVNIGTKDDPNFNRAGSAPNLDFTDKMKARYIYNNWGVDQLKAVDLDKDGDMDLVVISRDRIYVLRNPGPANFNLASWTVTEMNYNQRTGYNLDADGIPNRGGNTIAAADFTGNGHIDIVGGTVNNRDYIVFYENDGTGFFTRSDIFIPNPDCRGTTVLVAGDFDNDGLIDFFAANDAWNADPRKFARFSIYRNGGMVEGEVDWTFTCLMNCEPQIPNDYDVDMGIPIDYDQDGDIDIIVADGNHSGDYYLLINQLAPVYALTGVAVSENCTPDLDPSQYSITKVSIPLIRLGVEGRGPDGQSTEGLSVEFYVSNNDGLDWEPYLPKPMFTGNELQNHADLGWHEFKHYGSRLRWKAVLSATEDPMVEYSNASYETPTISEIQLDYAYVEKREYSRASAAATITALGGESKRLIIASSFIFPGWEGQLRAYDVTRIQLSQGSASALRKVTWSNLESDTGRELSAGVEIFWDAGLLLNQRSHGLRTIYAALRQDGALVRTPFIPGNNDILGPVLIDDDNDNSGLINFVRGSGRHWKLGDINHSTPAVVGPPSEDPLYMGAGYAEFAVTWKDRAKVVYVGANDGMLHCFDVATGEELWGFIPYNLLPRLTKMWPKDLATGTRYFDRQAYVDGTPSVADVQLNGNWRTVLVCGQGPGYGSAAAGGGRNYYWALDVTDPDNPVPLWEVTHTYVSGNKVYPTMGETWSTPAIGKVKVGAVDRWAAFMGSGYDNNPFGQDPSLGHAFYAVALDTGEFLAYLPIAKPNEPVTSAFKQAKEPYSYTNIRAVIPGSPTAVDIDDNGYIDRVYYGDLKGRLYRLDVTSTNTGQWTAATIYEDWLNYPIITKPAVWLGAQGGGTPRVYFGTGGDDNVPDNRRYAFIALIDGATANIEWFMGDPVVLGGLPAEKSVGLLGIGEKVWADPVIADSIVYFSTLMGNIESVNPCVDLDSSGRLYARYVAAQAGVPVGGTAFRLSDGSRPENLQLVSKARRAVTVGEVRRDQGLQKREIYIQEFDSTIEMLEQSIGSTMRIKSWREIYKIIK